MRRRELLMRAAGIGGAFVAGLGRMPSRVWVDIRDFESGFGSFLYQAGYRVVDADYGPIHVSRYLMQR